MKIVGIIPARYASSRLPGKPIIDICGKPMIWWVYKQAKKVDDFSEVYVATDDERIFNTCEKLNIKVVMTKPTHPDHIARVQELSDIIKADMYVCINGDEPLIDNNSISKVIHRALNQDDLFFVGAFRYLTDPAETIDSANIKIVTNKQNEAIYISRTPIPFPKTTLMFKYKKYVGIECFSKKALDFFASTEMGILEEIEDIDHLRFLENGIKIIFEEVNSESISVDTQKDLEKVRKIIKSENLV